MAVFIVNHKGDVARATATVFFLVAVYGTVVTENLGVPLVEPPSTSEVVNVPKLVWTLFRYRVYNESIEDANLKPLILTICDGGLWW